MAEVNVDEKGSGAGEEEKMEAGFKLNAEAPEFVPFSHAAVSVAGLYHPWYGFLPADGVLAADWFGYVPQEPLHVYSDAAAAAHETSADTLQRIVKQVESQLSNASLSANESLVKLMNKDPDGYVPLSALTPSKKAKSLGSDQQKLASALRSSSRLVVSQDGSKVRRKQAFTEREKEELQSRTVIVENLPEDHSRKNLEKIFRVAGSIRSLKVCRPQDPSSLRSSKGDFVVSNKLHALVEYETVDQAERAVERLNDEGNWRKGLRVRIMLRRTPRSVIRGRRGDCDPFDVHSDDDEPPRPSDSSAGTTSQPPSPSLDHSSEDSPTCAGRRAWAARSREKLQVQVARGLIALSAQAPGASPRSPRPAAEGGRGVLSPFPQPALPASPSHGESSCKNSPKCGPRMPDGTRGFSMGRGKPLAPAGGAAAAAP